MLIEGARALVCGGASGLGAATARRLHAGGAHVTIADVDAERGEALGAELGARFVACDVTDPAQVDEAVIAARADGVLRIAVTCAGIGWAEKTAGRNGPHGVEPFHRVVAVNLLGSFHLLRAAGAAMLRNERRRRRRGRRDRDDRVDRGLRRPDRPDRLRGVQGRRGRHDAAGRARPRRQRIRVCTIAPGLFDTPLLAGLPEEARAALGAQVPHPARLGDPEEYAALAAHIVENPMLNGEVVRLDGALRMPPR